MDTDALFGCRTRESLSSTVKFIATVIIVAQSLQKLESWVERAETTGNCNLDLMSMSLQSHPEALEDAKELPQASVRQHASRVLQLLGIEAAPTNVKATASNRPAAAPEPDLLGGLTDEPVSTTHQAQPASNANILGDTSHFA